MNVILGSRRLPRAMFLLFASVLLTTAASASWSDLVGSWYGSDSRSAAYTAARGELGRIFSEAAKRRVPQWLLMDRLREGTAKGISPDTLVSALHAELGRLEQARLLVDRAGIRGGFLSHSGDETLKEVGIYLRAGLPDTLVGQLLAAGAGMQRGSESALAACGAIMDLRAVAPLEDADSIRIGQLLMASGMQPSGYASLALVYGLGRSRGLSHDTKFPTDHVRDYLALTLAGFSLSRQQSALPCQFIQL